MLSWWDGLHHSYGLSKIASTEGTISDSIEIQAWKYYPPIHITEDETLDVPILYAYSEGDIDLYVRFGAPPTMDDYDCRPSAPEGVREGCELHGSGYVYFAVHGVSDTNSTLSYELELNAAPAQLVDVYDQLFTELKALKLPGGSDWSGHRISYDRDKLYHLRNRFGKALETQNFTDN